MKRKHKMQTHKHEWICTGWNDKT